VAISVEIVSDGTMEVRVGMPKSKAGADCCRMTVLYDANATTENATAIRTMRRYEVFFADVCKCSESVEVTSSEGRGSYVDAIPSMMVLGVHCHVATLAASRAPPVGYFVESIYTASYASDGSSLFE
jgi:hypothetical protein